jgi:hypothetical protein
VPWRLTHAGSPYRGWHDALDAALKGDQQLPRGFTHAAQRMRALFFYQKAKTLLTPHNNCKKPKVKKQKSPLTLGKKSWSQGLFSNYTIQKDMRIQKSSSNISCLGFFFFFKSTYVITLCNKVWKIIFYPLVYVQSFGFLRVKSSLY